MREIKFRAWHKSDNDKIESIFGRMVTPEYYINNEDYIVEQYTGLKDKNGVEIYEGDIIGFSDQIIDIQLVEMKEYYASSYGHGSSAEYTYYGYLKKGYYGDKITVLGNIHENPELLEK